MRAERGAMQGSRMRAWDDSFDYGMSLGASARWSGPYTFLRIRAASGCSGAQSAHCCYCRDGSPDAPPVAGSSWGRSRRWPPAGSAARHRREGVGRRQGDTLLIEAELRRIGVGGGPRAGRGDGARLIGLPEEGGLPIEPMPRAADRRVIAAADRASSPAQLAPRSRGGPLRCPPDWAQRHRRRR